MAFRPSTRRTVLTAAVVTSVLTVGLDQAAPTALAPVRAVVADVTGPLQNWVTHRDGTITRLTRERDAARRGLRDNGAAAATLKQLRALLGSAPADGQTFVPAQVVGFTTGTTPTQLRRVTLDVGSADGVSTDETVIASTGLVGRVVAVSRWNCTVQLLTDPSAVVGVRVAGSGVLATVSSSTPTGLPTRASGTLTVSVVGQGSVTKGDQLVTLGSVANTPYIPDVPVGTVISVDPDRGQGTNTAVVAPSVAFDRLSLVGVIVDRNRTTPRPAVTGGTS